MLDDFSFLELLAKGGVTIWILGLFSVAVVSVILERGFRFVRFRRELATSFYRISRSVKNGGVSAGAAAGGDTALDDIYEAGYSKRTRGRDAVLGAMELSARTHITGLERFLGVLGTVGSTAPFVGLFGTVLGIIRAFSDIAAAEGAGPSVVADGIAEALVATAAGLMVAIPAVIAYNYFVRALGRISVELESTASSFVDDIIDGGAEE